MKPILIAVIVIVLLALAAWCFWPRPQPLNGDHPVIDQEEPHQHGGPESLTPEATARLAASRSAGIGHLENQELPEANEAFQAVCKSLPDDALGWRNLAISQCLGLDKQGPNGTPLPDDEKARLLETARAAVDDLARVERESATVLYLRGRLAEQEGMPDEAFQSYYAAAGAAADDERLAMLKPALLFAAYNGSLPSMTEEVQRGGEDALGEAYAQLPDNLFLWYYWIPILAQREDPALADVLDSQQAELAFLAPSMRKVAASVDVPQLVEKCREAVAAGDWKSARQLTRSIANVVRGNDATRSDRIYNIDLHPLDFVKFAFGADVEQAIAALDAAKPPPGIPVTFKAADPPLPRTSDVQDACIADVDLDGRPDVTILQAGRVECYGLNDEGHWKLIAQSDVGAGYNALLLRDLDDDAEATGSTPAGAAPVTGNPGDDAQLGAAAEHSTCNAADLDLIAYGESGVLLLENRLDRESNTRSFERPVAKVRDADGSEHDEAITYPEIGSVQFAMAADLNIDGDMDLLFGVGDGFRVWSNQTRFSFADVTDHVENAAAHGAIVDAVAVDWDRDVDIDVLVATESEGIFLLEDLRHLTFRWRELDGLGGIDTDSLAVLEADGNVSWDLAAAGTEGVTIALTRTPHTGQVLLESARDVDASAATDLLTWDYDNDGYTDLLAWTADSLRILRGLPAGKFEVQENLLADLAATGEGTIVRCDAGDLDGDGDLDLLIANSGGATILMNEGGSENGWLDVQLAAQFSHDKQNAQTRRVNHYAIGSTLELRAGGSYQAQVVSGQVTHFGLGNRDAADVVRVVWTNGFPQNIMHPESRQQVCEVESPKGSCPFLYTWNGARFVFCTDVCWAAPIGMRNAQGEEVPCRADEYVLIPGELLQPRDDRYVLQVTAELWEAEYFDTAELIVVDHPDEVEIYSNEKVGPPDINAFGVHTAKMRNRPVSARNQAGRDLLPELAERDGVFAQPFDRRLMQGYTEDWFMEIDLGEVADPDNVKLFLTGWVFPTDMTISAALAEEPYLAGPQAPSVQVPDGEGGWQEAIPVMGFPGGKTKTIVVDLSGKLAAGDHRIRIASSMVLYWDEVFFTTGEAAEQVVMRPLAPVAADLHYRGFSLRVPRAYPAPPDFDYEQVRREPAWPPMDGRFTRYGNVQELMQSGDDLIVAMSSGDELTVEFDAPEGPPPGWKRDFILHSIGWDKDADLHTVAGQSSEPLPFRAMTAYPYPIEAAPETPAYREFLQRYQTRETDDAAFRRLLKTWSPGEQLLSP